MKCADRLRKGSIASAFTRSHPMLQGFPGTLSVDREYCSNVQWAEWKVLVARVLQGTWSDSGKYSTVMHAVCGMYVFVSWPLPFIHVSL
jgi:hypothetical protein